MGPLLAAALPALINAGVSAASGLFGKKDKPQKAKMYQSPTQQKQSKLVDDLLRSLDGGGRYSDLFNVDEAGFEKSFAEPARARFRNQTAPQIQQQYIASGQQRGSGLEDTLTRAGVDMDQMLNEYYSQFQQGAQNRKAGAINSILGAGPLEQLQQYGDNQGQSSRSAIAQGFGGYLTGGAGQDLSSILGAIGKKPDARDSLTDTYLPPRKGFENQQQVYNPYTGVQQ